MKLDKYQQNVVQTNQNMLVIAGAGTGKTFCIVQKINYLLNQGYSNNDFLIVSFTNESVNDLKKKLGNNIDIYTFHKLALKIVSNKYHLCSSSLLQYLIDEYFISYITDIEKRHLQFYFLKFNYQNLLNDLNFTSFKKLILTYINLIKANNLDINYLKTIYKTEKETFLITLIIKIYQIYKLEKSSQGLIDLDDLIVIASHSKEKFPYKHLFIDEFQDTSQIRFDLIYNIYQHSNSKLYFFGDDFQSIYHFSGCNLNIMLDIKKFIPDIKIIKLKKTFRNSQELINIANLFIMKNKKQISKSMISDKHLLNPIKIIYYKNPKTSFLKLIKNIDPNDLLILGRNNNDFLKFTNTPEKFHYLTVHRSKGLEAKNVIIINLTNDIYGFPNKIKNHHLIDKINYCDEMKYAEERRLFYVGITRTKNYCYLLVPYSNPSPFIKEIKKIVSSNTI
jgi:DNA helicase IV